jgi:hypothetical protein
VRAAKFVTLAPFDVIGVPLRKLAMLVGAMRNLCAQNECQHPDSQLTHARHHHSKRGPLAPVWQARSRLGSAVIAYAQLLTKTGPLPCGRSFSLMMPSRLATSV